MNLVEELNTHIRNSEITLFSTYSNYAKTFLPIFAEFIKQVKNPYEQIEDCTDIRYGQYTGFKKAIETILSELEKMKK